MRARNRSGEAFGCCPGGVTAIPLNHSDSLSGAKQWRSSVESEHSEGRQIHERIWRWIWRQMAAQVSARAANRATAQRELPPRDRVRNLVQDQAEEEGNMFLNNEHMQQQLWYRINDCLERRIASPKRSARVTLNECRFKSLRSDQKPPFRNFNGTSFLWRSLILEETLGQMFEYYKHIVKTWFSSISKLRQFTQF